LIRHISNISAKLSLNEFSLRIVSIGSSRFAAEEILFDLISKMLSL